MVWDLKRSTYFQFSTTLYLTCKFGISSGNFVNCAWVYLFIYDGLEFLGFYYCHSTIVYGTECK